MSQSIRKVTPEELEAFVTRAQAVVDNHYKEQGDVNPRIKLSAMPGRKFARIISEGRSGSRSAWCFIDLTNGDVLMSGGWDGPAKHARGNIYDANQGMEKIGPYGAAYLIKG